MNSTEIDSFLNGTRLYGNDLDAEGIENWFSEEAEGYASLGASNRNSYQYVYHAMNELHGFRQLQAVTFKHVLGLGSAYGDELKPILDRAQEITILEPSDSFSASQISGVPVTYRCPNASGTIALEDDSVDLVIAFGVLHHIPNVRFVISELARVLAPGGVLLLREPIVSMGDWRRPRPGLTKNERGIPLRLLRSFLIESGLTVHQERLVDFAPLTRTMARFVRSDVFNSPFLTKIDMWASRAMQWNLRYHATKIWHKLRPSSAFFVLSKPKS